MKVMGWVLVAAGLAFLSCTGAESGQTGSPSCALPCQCDYLTGFNFAKATVLKVEQDNVTIKIEELLNAVPGEEQYDQQEVTGSFKPPAWCSASQPDLPKVGDEVLVSFSVVNHQDAGWLLRTQPWGDQYQLIGGSRVSVAEALRLAEGQTCPQRFGSPCDDTPSAPEGGACEVSVVGLRARTAPGFAVAGLGLFCFARLRRRSRRSR